MDQKPMPSDVDNWRFICSTEEFEEPLRNYVGHGTSASVYRYESSGNVYAVKRFEFPQALGSYESPPKRIENVNLLLKLKHKNIVKLCHVRRSYNEVFLFFEFMEGGTVKTLLTELNNQKQFMAEVTALKYTAQILQGLEYLHDRSIAHRDIKPDNLLLTFDRSVVKLADFNLCKQIATSAQSSVEKGTFQYMAPEVVRCDKYNVRSDCWSVGATLVEFLSGSPPFSRYTNNAAVIGALREVGLTKPKPDYDLAVRSDLTQDCVDLLEDFFQPLSIRPSAAVLLDRKCFHALKLFKAAEDYSSLAEYSLDNDNKGNVLIINNKTYALSSERLGSEVDVNRLKSVFEVIRFKTKVENDLNGSGIIESIRSFLTNEETRKASSIILVIMAHGTNDAVLGVDEKRIALTSILDLLFKSTDKAQEGKPKLLLIQACRGVDRESVQEVSNQASLAAITATQSDSLNTSCDTNFKTAFECDGGTNLSTSSKAFCGDEDFTQMECSPSKSDVIVAHSTFSNYVSFRNKNDGSFYIQSFCDSVKRYWKTHHVLDILTEVHRLTTLAVRRATNTHTQVPQLVASLRKQYFLSHRAERENSVQTTSASVSEAHMSNTQQFSTPSSMSSPPSQQQQQQQEQQVLILAGGLRRKETLAYDPSSDTWAQVAPMSCQRHRAAATLWLGKVVVAGGRNSEGITEDCLKTVEMFDPETNSWTDLPDMLQARRALALACFKNTLFAIGGDNGNDALTSVERYNSDTKRWKLSAPLNFRRTSHCCAVLEVGILAAGGHNRSKTLDTCELFDCAKKKWKCVNSLQTAREWASAAIQDNKVYVFGGWDKNGENLDSVEQYDNARNKWTLLPVRLSVARYGLAAATVNDRVYVCGGEPGDRVVEYFDARTLQIRRVSPLLEDVSGGAAAAVPVTNQMLEKLLRN